ncbi:MAG: hypothetical protein JSV19_11150 [Phycisphaerales bacterium]|nr:MAG: hypothetical protein JSV19_11150 [Phycisphaerales bacterium]
MPPTPASSDFAGNPAPAQRPNALLCVVVVTACSAWITLSSWAASPPSPASAGSWVQPDRVDAVVTGVVLILALLCHLWVYSQAAASLALAPPVLLTAVWAGLGTAGRLDPSDAVAVLVMTVATALFSRRPQAVAPIGVITGMAVALSPLLVGAAAGLCIALHAFTGPAQGARPGGGLRPLPALVAGMVAGLLLMTAVAIGAGRPPWMAVSVAPVLHRLGPAAAWRHVSELLGLVAPVLAVGLLGLIAVKDPDDAGPERVRAGPAVYPAVCAWLLFNVVVAFLFPVVCAGHAIVWLAPAGLLLPVGWRSLRSLASGSMPMTIGMSGGVCLFLLAVLLWTPIRSAAAAILIAVYPP